MSSKSANVDENNTICILKVNEHTLYKKFGLEMRRTANASNISKACARVDIFYVPAFDYVSVRCNQNQTSWQTLSISIPIPITPHHLAIPQSALFITSNPTAEYTDSLPSYYVIDRATDMGPWRDGRWEIRRGDSFTRVRYTDHEKSAMKSATSNRSYKQTDHLTTQESVHVLHRCGLRSQVLILNQNSIFMADIMCRSAMRGSICNRLLVFERQSKVVVDGRRKDGEQRG